MELRYTRMLRDMTLFDVFMYQVFAFILLSSVGRELIIAPHTVDKVTSQGRKIKTHTWAEQKNKFNPSVYITITFYTIVVVFYYDQ